MCVHLLGTSLAQKRMEYRARQVETVKKMAATVVQLILILTVGGTIGYVLLNIFYLREIYLDIFEDLLANRFPFPGIRKIIMMIKGAAHSCFYG